MTSSKLFQITNNSKGNLPYIYSKKVLYMQLTNTFLAFRLILRVKLKKSKNDANLAVL